MKRSLWGLLTLCAELTFSVVASEKLSPQLAERLLVLSPDEATLAWVFFRDKGRNELNKGIAPRTLVSARSYARRLKSRFADSALDYSDLPIEPSYVVEIAQRVIRVRQQSKWLNGVSVRATRAQMEQIALLPFVSRLELVMRMKRSNEQPTEPPQAMNNANAVAQTTSSLDYGLSLGQVSMINIPAVHATGNYGQGVVIGVLDNGFRLLNHESLDTLRPRILATYDFVDKKESVVPNNPDSGFGFHGMYILSAIGGFKTGQVIGPAFGASYVLARTENDSSETPFEEDNWVAAIEWMDSIGVDITTTSLGYLTYDAPYPSWTWQQMDGNTTAITRAADMAVAKGIVVFNSAGNNGLNTSRNTLNAPADGDSVLTIGALRTDGQRASFSSVGPTVDGRIKPDLMAQGVAVWCASHIDTTRYIVQQGTSLSTPLAAGVAALVLHENPSLTPLQVARILKRTASNATSPNNLVGWGTINAAAAVGIAQTTRNSYQITAGYPNPFNPSTTIVLEYSLPEPSTVSLRVYNLLGQEVKSLLVDRQGQGIRELRWDGTNNEGSLVASGTYFARLVAKSLINSRSHTSLSKIIFLR